MIGVVICTHAELSKALLDSALMILGSFENVVAVSVDSGDSPEHIQERLKEAVEQVNTGAGVLVLCDMFGGTPSNMSLSLLSDTVEVITGVNLPMLLKLHSSRHGALKEVAEEVQTYGRDNILVAGALLQNRGGAS